MKPFIKGYHYAEFTGDALKQGAQLTLTNRLFVNQWTMRDMISEILDDDASSRVDYILIIFDEFFVPCGALFREQNYSNYTVNTFVRGYHRRLGLGTAMVKQAKKTCGDKELISYYGIKGSETFYRSIGLVCHM